MIIDLKWVTETGRTAKPSDNIDKMEAKSSVSRLDMEYIRKADSDKRLLTSMLVVFSGFNVN